MSEPKTPGFSSISLASSARIASFIFLFLTLPTGYELVIGYTTLSQPVDTSLTTFILPLGMIMSIVLFVIAAFGSYFMWRPQKSIRLIQSYIAFVVAVYLVGVAYGIWHTIVLAQLGGSSLIELGCDDTECRVVVFPASVGRVVSVLLLEWIWWFICGWGVVVLLQMAKNPMILDWAPETVPNHFAMQGFPGAAVASSTNPPPAPESETQNPV